MNKEYNKKRKNSQYKIQKVFTQYKKYVILLKNKGVK